MRMAVPWPFRSTGAFPSRLEESTVLAGGVVGAGSASVLLSFSWSAAWSCVLLMVRGANCTRGKLRAEQQVPDFKNFLVLVSIIITVLLQGTRLKYSTRSTNHNSKSRVIG